MFYRAVSPSASWLVFALLFSALAGCATTPPVQEMSDARQAIAAAREAGAEALATLQLRSAEDLLRSAEAFLEVGTSNAYWQARKAAIGAKERAFEAFLASRSATSGAVDGSSVRSP